MRNGTASDDTSADDRQIRRALGVCWALYVGGTLAFAAIERTTGLVDVEAFTVAAVGIALIAVTAGINSTRTDGRAEG